MCLHGMCFIIFNIQMIPALFTYCTAHFAQKCSSDLTPEVSLAEDCIYFETIY